MYALHKQSVSGDAPPVTNDDELSSVADRAKIAAWRTKRGIDQADAMARYVEECDRQLSVYGTRDGDGNSSGGASTSSPNGSAMHSYSSPAAATTAAPPMKGGETSASGNGNDNDAGNPNNTSYKSNANTTPLNAPASYEETNNDGSGDGDSGGAGGVLLCPRGLAAVPLLCAAASESRSAYLARLQVTHPSNGVSSRTLLCHLICRACFAHFTCIS